MTMKRYLEDSSILFVAKNDARHWISSDDVGSSRYPKWTEDKVVTLPSTVIVSHILPYLDRVSFNNVITISTEIFEETKSAQMNPPWPQTTLPVESEVRTIAFSPQNNILVCGCEDGSVRVWKNKNGNCTILPGHEADILTIAFAMDGSFFATGSRDCTVRIWSVMPDDKVSCTATFKGHRYPVHSISVSPNGRFVASNSYEKVVRLWSVPRSSSIGTIRHKIELESVAIAPNGRNIVTATWDGCVRLWETSPDGEIDASLPPKIVGRALPSTRICFSGNGQFIYGLRGFRLRRWDLQNNFGLSIFTGHRVKRVICVAISPNGETVAYGEFDGAVRVAELTDESTIKVPSRLLVGGTLDSDEECTLAFSPDGRTLASATVSGKIQLWTI